MTDVAVAVLLVLGCAAQALAVAGVALMRNAFDRLHYTGAAMLGSVLLAAAVLAREGFSLIGDKGILVAAVIVFTSPVLVQAIGRAARVSEHGSLHAAGSDVKRAS